jgi:hypothetical protein
VHGENLLRPESGIHPPQLPEAATEKTGTREEDKRERSEMISMLPTRVRLRPVEEPRVSLSVECGADRAELTEGASPKRMAVRIVTTHSSLRR